MTTKMNTRRTHSSPSYQVSSCGYDSHQQQTQLEREVFRIVQCDYYCDYLYPWELQMLQICEALDSRNESALRLRSCTVCSVSCCQTVH